MYRGGLQPLPKLDTLDGYARGIMLDDNLTPAEPVQLSYICSPTREPMNARKSILTFTAAGWFAVVPVVDEEPITERMPDDQMPPKVVEQAEVPWQGAYNTSDSRAHNGWRPVDVNMKEDADATYAFDTYVRTAYSSADLIVTTSSG